MTDTADWPRVPITKTPAPPGTPLDIIEMSMIAICRPLWDEQKIPVVAWGCEFDGTEILPPRLQ